MGWAARNPELCLQVFVAWRVRHGTDRAPQPLQHAGEVFVPSCLTHGGGMEVARTRRLIGDEIPNRCHARVNPPKDRVAERSGGKRCSIVGMKTVNSSNHLVTSQMVIVHGSAPNCCIDLESREIKLAYCLNEAAPC